MDINCYLRHMQKYLESMYQTLNSGYYEEKQQQLALWPQEIASLFVTYFLIEVQLIYNILLVSTVQQSDPVIHIHIYIFYKILSIVPCAIH